MRQAWHVNEPGVPLTWGWHMEAICLHVQAALEDWMALQSWHRRREELKTKGEDPEQAGPQPAQRIQNLLINVPPGTSKSRIVAVCAVAWMWLRWPSWRVICLSSNPRVSLRDGDYCLTLVQSDWYQKTFQLPWKLDKDQCSKSHFANTASGWRKAFGMASRITGDRADCLIIDDPHDAEEVNSDAKRIGVIEKWDNAIHSRVNDLRSSLRIGVMQRVHEADWSGHVLASGERWAHLCIPMEWEPQRVGARRDPIPAQTVIGWRDPRTEKGELMEPVRFPEEVLIPERKKARRYAGQYQQRPAPAEGDLFKAVWFAERYRELPPLVEVWSCWDTAQKAKEQNDESACTTMGRGEDGQIYVLGVLHGRWETPDLVRKLVAHAQAMRLKYSNRYRGDYVEDKSSGSTVIQYVRRSNPELVLIPIQVEADKVSRANGVTPLCEAGRVLLPDTEFHPEAQDWVDTLLDQLLTFPGGSLDDILDSFVYCLKRVVGTLGKRKVRVI